MHWHSSMRSMRSMRSMKSALLLQVTHLRYQSALKDPWNATGFLQLSLRKQRKDWWKVFAGRSYQMQGGFHKRTGGVHIETLVYTGTWIKELGIKKGISITCSCWKMHCQACLSQVFVCNTNFSLCFYCRCSPCTLRQYQLCTFMYSQIGSVQITLQINHSVGTCTKHY